MIVLPKFLKKLVASLLVSLVLILSVATPTHAQASKGTWYSSNFGDWYGKVYNPTNSKDIFGERYTAAQVQWVIYGLAAFLINAPSNGNSEAINCVMNKQVSECVDALQNAFPSTGAPGDTTTPTSSIEHTNKNLWGQVFEERPISAVTFFKDAARNIHLIPEANAQTTPGFGFSALNPVLELWKASRNVVYSLMVLIIIVLAFMIMFKVKLNPQTSITVQSAIPKVIIALILITFSYAIAGLLIDLMYVVLGLISIAFANSGMWGKSLQPSTASDFFNLMTQGPAVGIPGGLAARLGIFGFMIRYWGGFMVTTLLLTIGANSPFINFGSFIGLLLAFLSIIILLINGVKIIWILFKTLAQVLLSVIVAPFQILLGVVIPNFGFGSWIRSYVANLAVFPTVGVLLVLASLFLTLSINEAFNGLLDLGLLGEFIDFLTGQSFQQSYWPPLLGTNDPKTTMALIYLGTSFVMITIIPKTVDLIQALIKGSQFNYGAAISEATAGPFVTAGNVAMFAGKASESLKQLPIGRGSVPKSVDAVEDVIPRK